MNCGGQNNSNMAKGEDSAASFIKLVKMILFQCIKNRKILIQLAKLVQRAQTLFNQTVDLGYGGADDIVG